MERCLYEGRTFLWTFIVGHLVRLGSRGAFVIRVQNAGIPAAATQRKKTSHFLYFRIDFGWGKVFTSVNKCQNQANRVPRIRSERDPSR